MCFFWFLPLLTATKMKSKLPTMFSRPCTLIPYCLSDCLSCYFPLWAIQGIKCEWCSLDQCSFQEAPFLTIISFSFDWTFFSFLGHSHHFPDAGPLHLFFTRVLWLLKSQLKNHSFLSMSYHPHSCGPTYFSPFQYCLLPLWPCHLFSVSFTGT